MPELPEVETIRRGLERFLPGKEIAQVEVRYPKIFSGDPLSLVGKKITAVNRKGKLLIVSLEEERVLTIHLKMTGQLIFRPSESGQAREADEEELIVGGHPEAAYLEPLPHKHTHLIMTFSGGSTLYFNDLRKFGRITLLPKAELSNLAFLRKLGPEPLEAQFNVPYLTSQLQKKARQRIKTFLLDQENIAGLGNIYADESLFRAMILPDRLAGSLSGGEIRNLHDSIQETLELAIQHGGSSAKDYVDAVGERGTFLKVANVYRRTNLQCNRCLEGIISRKVIGGRSSHYCPECQR